VLDAKKFLKENFDFIKNNSLEGCPSALAWLPENSEIWTVYGSRVDCPWKLCWERRKSWSQCEAILHHSGVVMSALFSPDGMHIVSVCQDNTVQIWNMATAECEEERSALPTYTSLLSSPDNSKLPVASSIPNGVFIHHDHNNQIQVSLELSFLNIYKDIIFHTKNLHKLCIPPHFRKPSSIGYHLSKICLGHGSGQFLLLEAYMVLILYSTL